MGYGENFTGDEPSAPGEGGGGGGGAVLSPFGTVVSASTMDIGAYRTVLVTDGNTINNIVGDGLVDGTLLVLIFDENTSMSAGILAAGLSFSALTNDSLTLVYVDGDWRELSRTVVGPL